MKDHKTRTAVRCRVRGMLALSCIAGLAATHSACSSKPAAQTEAELTAQDVRFPRGLTWDRSRWDLDQWQ